MSTTMSIPEIVFWCAVALPIGLGLGLFLSALFLGIDWMAVLHGKDADE